MMEIKLQPSELEELRYSTDLRVSQLRKLRSGLELEDPLRDDIDARLLLHTGDEETAGLKDRLSEQLTLYKDEDDEDQLDLEEAASG